MNTGHTVTLAGAPTEGNILILGKFAETAGFSPPDPPSGWSRIIGPVTFHDSINTQTLEILARCAVAGESATIEVGDASFSHWAFVSEWIP
jgi:hypothetical protein